MFRLENFMAKFVIFYIKSTNVLFQNSCMLKGILLNWAAAKTHAEGHSTKRRFILTPPPRYSQNSFCLAFKSIKEKTATPNFSIFFKCLLFEHNIAWNRQQVDHHRTHDRNRWFQAKLSGKIKSLCGIVQVPVISLFSFYC